MIKVENPKKTNTPTTCICNSQEHSASEKTNANGTSYSKNHINIHYINIYIGTGRFAGQ